MKRLISFLAVGIAANYALGGVAACSSSAPTPLKKAAAVGERGTLTMALQAVSESGKVYRLRNATFLVNSIGFIFPGQQGGGVVSAPGPRSGGVISAAPDAAPPPIGDIGGAFGAGAAPPFLDGGFIGAGGSPVFFDGGFAGIGQAGSFGGFFPSGGSPGFPTGTIVLNSEDDPTAPVIERFLSPSEYDIELLDGWFVEQVDNLLGTSAFVPATLTSQSFQFFNIQSDQETFVKYDFDVDGSRVSFGPPGRLIIGIGVTETNGQGTCGDGVVQGMESCDGFNLNGATCASVTMGSAPFGTLFCDAKCQLDATFCTSSGVDGGTGGMGTGGFGGGFGIDGGQMPRGGASGSVGFPGVDAGPAGTGAGGASGKPPGP